LFFERLAALLVDPTARQSKHGWRELQAIYLAQYQMNGARLDP
jgi:hypothetical protein